MKVISKADAMRIKTAHPDSRRSRFDSGKYSWYGSEKDYIGKVVMNVRGVLAVYAQRQSDKDGVYARLHCIVI